MSRQSNEEFWDITVPRARGEVCALLAEKYRHEAQFRRPQAGSMLGSLLVGWASPDGQRVFSLDLLEPDETLAIDHFFKTLASGQRALTLCLREPAKHLALVFECLERFIIQGAPEDELDRQLDAAAAAAETGP